MQPRIPQVNKPSSTFPSRVCHPATKLWPNMASADPGPPSHVRQSSCLSGKKTRSSLAMQHIAFKEHPQHQKHLAHRGLESCHPPSSRTALRVAMLATAAKAFAPSLKVHRRGKRSIMLECLPGGGAFRGAVQRAWTAASGPLLERVAASPFRSGLM